MAAVWTPPRTWRHGELATKELLNTHLRDNMDWLKDRPIASGGAITDISTTSTSLVLMTNMSDSLVVNGDRLLIAFTGWFTCDSFPRTLTMAIAVDGSTLAEVARTNVTTAGNGGTPCHFFARVSDILAGTRTIAIQWKTSGGTMNQPGATIPRGFFALEAT